MDVISTPSPTRYDDSALHELAEQVGSRLRANRQMVCTAESCTGGWIAKMITDIPGLLGLVRLRPGRLQLRGEAGAARRAPGDADPVRRGQPRNRAGNGLGRTGHLRRQPGRGRDRHRRAERRHARQAGRHGLDRLEAARRLSEGPGLPLRWRPRGGPAADRRRGPAGLAAPSPTEPRGLDGRESVSSITTNHGTCPKPSKPSSPSSPSGSRSMVSPPSQAEIARPWASRACAPPSTTWRSWSRPASSAHPRPGARHPPAAVAANGHDEPNPARASPGRRRRRCAAPAGARPGRGRHADRRRHRLATTWCCSTAASSSRRPITC